MKHLLLFTLILGLFTACNKTGCDKPIPNPKTGMVGNWQLIAVLADPGDGSGTFQPVKSNKIIEFHEDGTLSSNGSICDMSTEANNPSEGTFSMADSVINVQCNTMMPSGLSFELKGDELIIQYQCIEACQHKYRRVSTEE